MNKVIFEQINSIKKEKNNPDKIEELCNYLLKALNDNFINSLTTAELEVFKVLQKKTKHKKEFTFFSAELAEECQVSRTVISNLFSKIKNAKIAEVKSLGPKGTYVRVINTIIL